ncbi:MAG: hypothetical protein MUE51_11715, partial [Thermoleophilia bacterium]|nr:hypothetical protein [Thermoleophilia bacterium]
MSGTRAGHPWAARARVVLAAVLLALLVAGAQGTTPLGTQTRVSVMGPDGNPALDGDYAAVAHNPRADQYLVVWEGTPDAGGREIWGRLVAADGTPIGAQLRISDMGPDGDPAFDANDPAVAYNPRADEYLVVWEGDDDTGALVHEEYEIYAQRVSAAGAEVGPNDIRISDMGPDGSPFFTALPPDVVANPDTNEYLVAWTGDDDTPPLVDNEREVFVQRLSAAGAEVGPNDARVSDLGPAGDPGFDASG